MLDKEFENNMKENKDLSKSFAIIFGIKPEEVPSKSSGIKMSTTKSKRVESFLKEKGWEFKNNFWQKGTDYRGYSLEQALQLYLPKEESIKFDLTYFEDILNGLLVDNSNIKGLQNVVGFLKENGWENKGSLWSKDSSNSDLSLKEAYNTEIKKQKQLKTTDKLAEDLNNIISKEKEEQPTASNTKEGVLRNSYVKNVLSKEEELKQASVLENMKEFNKETASKKKTEATEREYTYKVLFKDNREAVKITTSIMESLSKYFDRRNLNSNGGFSLASNLMWGYDEGTGEMLCLDSNSINSIVRI